MTTMTLRINERDGELIRKFINFHGMTISDFARQAMLEKIEDEYDLTELRKVMTKPDKEFISHQEMMAEFGL
jgi:hypothetical protein